MTTRTISVFSLLVAAGFCHMTPASADEISELQEAIRQQRLLLEEQSLRLEALRAHLAEGAGQAARKDFVEGFDIESVIERTKARA